MFYCSTVWSNTSKGNLQKLQLMQNFGARIVLGLKKYDHISAGLKSLKWLSDSQKLYFNDILMVFKCVNNLVPEYLKNKFKLRSQVNTRTTRTSNTNVLNIHSVA